MSNYSNSNPSTDYPDYLAQICHQYPGVPYPHLLTWDQSDRELPLDEEWQRILKATAVALRHGADVCEQFAANRNPTTCNELIQSKNALLCAVHKAEDLVTELTMNYPLPVQSNYKIAKSNPDIASRTPDLLINTEEHIIIWMPRLPSKHRGPNSLIFQELQEMLQVSRFPRIDQWHCDFLHVYHPTNLAGVLDVDNYNYKPIIDALVIALCSQDSFDHFSYGAYNMAHLTLKPGCYIHICKRQEKVPIFQFFEEMISHAQSL